MPPYKTSYQWYGCMAHPDRHGLAHLAQHPVRGIPEETDLLGQAQGRQATFVADYQIDGRESLHQGQIGVNIKGASRRGSLASAMIALIDLARDYPMALIVPAMRVLKTIGLALLFQRFGAFIFCTKLCLVRN